MGRHKHLGSLESFLWHVPQLSGAGILCFPHPESPQGAYPGWPQWLTARWWASFFQAGSLRACCLLGQLCGYLMAVTSFVYWHGRQYFSSHSQSVLSTTGAPELGRSFPVQDPSGGSIFPRASASAWMRFPEDCTTVPCSFHPSLSSLWLCRGVRPARRLSFISFSSNKSLHKGPGLMSGRRLDEK